MHGQAALVVIAVIAACVSLNLASSVFAPLALALLFIALVEPLQSTIQSKMPKVAALVLTIVVLASCLAAFGWLIIWAFGGVARLLVNDALQFQAIAAQFADWLESHGIAVKTLWAADQLNVGWLVRVLQTITVRLNSTAGFWLIAMVYVVLGLLEVDQFRQRISNMPNKDASRVLLSGSGSAASKIRSYMVVRTQMSLLTGLLFAATTYFVGLPLALEWGVIAFALNYIPFLGSLIATLFPTAFALVHLQSWQAALGLFIALNIVQFAVGSYLEPRVTGSRLSISPSLVLFSVFFWGFLWGIFGAFIGVPIVIAILAFCAQSSSMGWITHLFGHSSSASSAQTD